MVTLLDPDGFLDLAADALADANASWSLGTFGAVAEFLRLPGEPVVLEQDGATTAAVTTGGGIRLGTAAPVLPVAFERPTGRRSWTTGVVFCLPVRDLPGPGRDVVTELGPDASAVRAGDRGAVLFDLGLDVPHLEACVRTEDPALLGELRRAAGRPLDKDLITCLREASPHRVFRTPVGRVEVFGRISTRHGVSPAAPHTHLLPRLLQHRRTHHVAEPIPDGWVPCAHLYPPHPARDVLGRDVAFQAGRDSAVQALLDRFGHPRARERVRAVLEAIRNGLAPDTLPPPEEAVERMAQKVTLRRLVHLDGHTPVLHTWLETHDTVRQAGTQEKPAVI